MRYRIKFRVLNEGAIIPFKHQALIESVISRFKNQHAEYSDFTAYTFSCLKGQYKAVPGGLLILSQNLILVISSCNGKFVEAFAESILNEKAILIGDLWLAPERSFSEPVLEFSEEIKYLCLSPLIITDSTFSNSQFHDYLFEENCSDALYESTIERMEQSGLYSEDQLNSFYKFQIVPDRHYLEKLFYDGKSFCRDYPITINNDYITVQGYTFPFTLFAAPEVHEFIYFNGLGAYTHKGYGMLDRTDNELVKKKGRMVERENVV